jgi:hypothetical protein
MKHKLSPLIVAVLLVIPLCNCQKGMRPTAMKPAAKDAVSAAGQALKTFPTIVDEKNFRAMGFKSVSEARQAKLGKPMKVFMVRLDRLSKYEPGTPPNNLLDTATSQVMFPLTIDNKARCAITVSLRNEQWVVTRFGSSNLIKLVSSARQASMKMTELPPSAYSIVRVPALNMVFVAHQDRDTNELMLTPTLDNPDLEMKAGSSMPANEVFNKLAPLAQGHSGLPT